MARPRRQLVRKKFDGKCYFCGESNYDLLDSHRILHGSDGGKYDWVNMLTLCASCHRRVHSGEIRIDRRYQATVGHYVLHYWVGDQEFWKKD